MPLVKGFYTEIGIVSHVEVWTHCFGNESFWYYYIIAYRHAHFTVRSCGEQSGMDHSYRLGRTSSVLTKTAFKHGMQDSIGLQCQTMWWSKWDKSIDIHQRSQTSHTAPCNGVVSHGPWLTMMGSNWGSLSFCRPHTQNKCATIFLRRAAFYACLSSRSDRGRCRWHTHLTNHGYFDYGKNPKTPNLRPMPE